MTTPRPGNVIRSYYPPAGPRVVDHGPQRGHSPPHPPTSTLIGMLGLGDNIYQRPYVRAEAERFASIGGYVALTTPWPQLYADLPAVRCFQSRTKLRTQAKNEATIASWSQDVTYGAPRKIHYSVHEMRQGASIFESMALCFPAVERPKLMDLPPDFGVEAPKVSGWGRPLAFVRPPTVRKEWFNESRNCDPLALNTIVRKVMLTHHVVSVADLVENEEWLVGPPPPAHQRFHKGELTTMQVLALARSADLILGPPGWIAPFGIASNVPTFIVLGGQGGHNGPAKLQPEWLGPGRLGFAVPDEFCPCGDNRHACKKAISNPVEQFDRWLQSRGMA